VALAAFREADVFVSGIGRFDVSSPVATDAEAMVDLPGIQLYSLLVLFVIRIAFGFVAVRAFPKLFAVCDLLDGMMAADASDSLPGLMRENRIAIYLRLVDLMIEQNEPAPAGCIEPDVDLLNLSLSIDEG
jgi:hypothetical protein